jgi:hypothetical protein
MAGLGNYAFVTLSAWNVNRLDILLGSNNAANGNGISPYLQEGQTYRIEVKQAGGLSPYTLNITRQ